MSLAIALVASVAAAVPLGPCADVPQCMVRLPPAVPAELLAALAALGLPVGDPGGAEPLTKVGGDRAFVLEALEEKDQVRVRLSSLQRAPAIYGERTRVVPTTGGKFSARARTLAWRLATEGAFEDLGEKIAEALGQGVRRLKLSIRLNGLEPAARQQASEQTLACLKSRLDLIGASTTPTERAGYLEEELEYVPTKDEPRDPLEHHVAWVKAALLGGPRAPCSLVGTPLSKYTVLVSADALNRGVIVAFDR